MGLGGGGPAEDVTPPGKGLLRLEAQELMPPEKTPEVRRLSIPPTSTLELGLLLPWQVDTGCPGKKGLRDFPGGPVVKTALVMQWAWVQSLVRELRSHMLCDMAEKKGGAPSPPSVQGAPPSPHPCLAGKVALTMEGGENGS